LNAVTLSTTRRFSFPAKYDSLGIYTFLVDRAVRVAPRREELRVGLTEALSNAVLHGALGVSSELREKNDFEGFSAHVSEREATTDPNLRIDVVLRTTDEGVEIAITDPGRGFDWANQRIRPSRGLALLFQSFDRVEWNATGNVLRLFVAGADL
jgi:hypothetical protein